MGTYSIDFYIWKERKTDNTQAAQSGNFYLLFTGFKNITLVPTLSKVILQSYLMHS